MADQAPELISLKQVGFRYPGSSLPSLAHVDLRVNAGELVLLTGPSGCGKSTLLKVISGIIPLESSGSLSGRVLVDGQDTKDASLPLLARKVGMVFQNPDDQLCAATVYEEAAFGPRNLSCSEKETRQRVDKALEMVGLSDQRGQQTAKLSGGQKQRLTIAAQLAMQPLVMVLDEPISQLDPQGASEVLSCLTGLCAKGMAVVLVEHRLTECLPLASRVAIMRDGRVLMDCPSTETGRYQALIEELGLKLPDSMKARRHWRAGNHHELCAGLRRLKKVVAPNPMPGRTLLSLKDVCFSYPEAESPALSNISLELNQGEVLAVIGPNGSGKSTLLGIMAGLNQPQSGKVILSGKPVIKRPPPGKAGLLFQNPDLLLLETKVRRELMSGPLFLRKPLSKMECQKLADGMGLGDLLDMPPWALSTGQRLRAALAAILATKPQVLMLDEPTTGQDQGNIHRLLTALSGREKLGGIIISSHDLETVARFSHRTAVMLNGRLYAIGSTRNILAKVARENLPGIKPHWPLRISMELGIEPPFITYDEMIAADSNTMPFDMEKDSPPCTAAV